MTPVVRGNPTLVSLSQTMATFSPEKEPFRRPKIWHCLASLQYHIHTYEASR